MSKKQRRIIFLFVIIFTIMSLIIYNRNIKSQLENIKIQNQEITYQNNNLKYQNQKLEIKNNKLEKNNTILRNVVNLELKDEESIFYDIPLTRQQQLYIFETCKEFNVNYKVFLGMLQLESNFKTDLVSYNKNNNGILLSKDRGISQINNRYEHWYAQLAGLEEWDVFDFEDCIRMGVAGLAYYVDYWRDSVGDEKELYIRAMNMYNMGEFGFLSYERNTGMISRYYDRIVFNHKSKLEFMVLKDN